MKLRDALKDKLSSEEFELFRGSFDVIGDIAIVEIPRELRKKKALIGKTLIGLLKSVKVVAMKAGAHTGKYRLQKLSVIAGKKRKVTVHKESGILLRLDVEKCYYSPRLGSERLRIASLIKPNEKILVAGSGVGVYPLVLAKHSKAKELVGVEINPVAHKFAGENLVLNKLQGKVKLIKGDAKKATEKFDRLIIAIPHLGVKLVPSMLKLLKKNGFLHVLDFAEESNKEAPARLLVELCKKKKRKCRILRVVKTGTPGVRRLRVCIDAKMFH